MTKPDLTIKPDEIEWRVGATFDRNGAKWGTLLGYIDARLAMEKLDLLDEKWSSRMEPVQLNGDAGVRCTLTVNGVSREDVGTASTTEPLKGAFSDALKRAAVHFGIGRELYDLPHIAVECNVGQNGKVKSPKALPSWDGKRWTIDRNVGFVRYDNEPNQQPAANAQPPVSGGQSGGAEAVQRPPAPPSEVYEESPFANDPIDPTLDATNWRAEHALRPAVVTRKTCGGGNRTIRGAQTQQILTSVLRTAQQRGLDSTTILVSALQAPKPVVLDAFQSAPLH